NPVLSSPDESEYHLWAVAPAAKANGSAIAANDDLYHNGRVDIDTSIEGIARLAGSAPPAWLSEGLQRIQTEITGLQAACPCVDTVAAAHKLAPVYRDLFALRARVAAGGLAPEAESNVLFQLDTKISQFQDAFRNLLGLELTVVRTGRVAGNRSPFSGQSAEETSNSVTPGETFYVRMHT